MESVKLQPLKDTVVIHEIDYSNADQDSKVKKINSDNLSLLRPSEVKQYLFKVTFKNVESEPRPLVVGKLDITWRNTLGEIGHLQTHPLSQPVILYLK